MASSGDEITYTFSGGFVTEDLSNIDTVTVRRMDGAGGGSYPGQDGSPGAGGTIREAQLDVASDETLELFVGGQGGNPEGGTGRNDGGKGAAISGAEGGTGGGGSTEMLIGGSLIAAVDAGGGGGNVFFGSPSGSFAGGGGARGGNAPSSSDGTAEDGEGTGFGGDGGDDNGGNGGDGGQELLRGTLLPRGEMTAGGGSGSDGEVVLLFDKPLKPINLSASENLDNIEATIDLSWDNDNRQRFNRIYRTTASSPTFPDDFVEVGTAAKGTTTFRDGPPDFETAYTYRVTSESGGESAPSDPVTITTSSAGELVVTLTGTNSPVTTGDTLELDVDVENIGDYRADEDIDADLEPQ